MVGSNSTPPSAARTLLADKIVVEAAEKKSRYHFPGARLRDDSTLPCICSYTRSKMDRRGEISDSEDEVVFSGEDESEPERESSKAIATPAHQPKTKSKPTKLKEKDEEELELERLVFGNRAGFRQNLFTDDGVLEVPDAEQGQELQLARADSDLEQLDDADLFMWDTAAKALKISMSA